MIRAGPGNSLGVISPTGRLNLNGPQKINFGSFAGPINVQALNHIHLRARRGNVSTLQKLNAIHMISYMVKFMYHISILYIFFKFLQITLDSSSIKIPSLGNDSISTFNTVSNRGNLRLFVPALDSANVKGKRRNNNFAARQLCACQDGKLFTAKSSSHCVANYQICPD